ncbi:MAG: hypothetical protein LW832_01460 [Parachlamydia sp.]|nr:hypothetical protein [Parachlamydia sp.]
MSYSTPILYLSRYINNNKNEYYQLLQAVRNNNSWEPWILYMLDGLEMRAPYRMGLQHVLTKVPKITKIASIANSCH